MTTKSITLKQTHTQTPYKKTKIEVPTCANLEKSTKKALRRKQEEEKKKKKLTFLGHTKSLKTLGQAASSKKAEPERERERESVCVKLKLRLDI
jgi:hypothetical protein